ncbi:glycoside hydrolase family 43 protein [Paenibacillus sp. sptzw28]|uniref:glycoside hydrolase family 43 protein n=1 Tax=Paenibacillus sp. sptzw28 TaxID=715179 RepID=UPI001C6EAFA1|nr:glycoside hydrolase family 43 protein [Paenibacillus sp. sptzw28]QYR23562.1 glycoside hydrolase family 43 protein [Paenibacillus sp. sptzw28]
MPVYNAASDTSNPCKEHRLTDIPVHDPFVLTDGKNEVYYMYTSGIPGLTDLDRHGVLVYKSTDLLEWEGPYVVFTVPDDVWAHPGHGKWAPEVHEYKGRFYLFVTLHNNDSIIAEPPEVWKINHMRGTSIAVSDSPEGPFELLKTDAPVPPADFMTLDGTLYVDEDGQPWMVYAHEWIQLIDGTFEAVRLNNDLSAGVGEPIHLFKASDAPWINAEATPNTKHSVYVTDGCQLYKGKGGQLLMLWSSYNKGGYVQTIARSRSGKLKGPWEQLEPLVYGDSGHGMLFQTFTGERMLILHQPFKLPDSRAKIYEMEETEDGFKVIRAREDLHGT